jgi:hypothetical protein
MQPTYISIFPIMGYVRKMPPRKSIDMRKSNRRMGMSIMSLFWGRATVCANKIG